MWMSNHSWLVCWLMVPLKSSHLHQHHHQDAMCSLRNQQTHHPLSHLSLCGPQCVSPCECVCVCVSAHPKGGKERKWAPLCVHMRLGGGECAGRPAGSTDGAEACHGSAWWWPHSHMGPSAFWIPHLLLRLESTTLLPLPPSRGRACCLFRHPEKTQNEHRTRGSWRSHSPCSVSLACEWESEWCERCKCEKS